jgi:hypothetical protein
MQKIFLLTIILLFFPGVSPLLFAQPQKDEPVELKSLSIEVNANLFTAVTALNLEFYNPNNKVLDGEYNFSLQPGQFVTGFALDINGFMREGVIVDKQKGRIAYENIIRRRVDPGLLEMTGGNQYRVRVYPMPAKGIRKIRITISQLLAFKGNMLQYSLPLDFPGVVTDFSALVSVTGSKQLPVSNNGILKEEKFVSQNDGFTLVVRKEKTLIKDLLSFYIPVAEKAPIFCTSSFSDTGGFLTHIKPEIPAYTLPVPRSVAVFWDVSGSAAKRNLAKEILFLESYISARNINELTIITFSNKIHATQHFLAVAIKFAPVRKMLEAQRYDGGTQLSSVDCNIIQADAYMLFSDGIHSFGNEKITTGNKPWICVNSSSSANHNLLKKLSSQTSGRYVDLFSTDPSTAVEEIRQPVIQLMSVTQNGQPLFTNMALPSQSSGWFTVTGILGNTSDDVVFSFGDNGIVQKQESVSVKNISIEVKNERAFWLQQYEYLLQAGSDISQAAFLLLKIKL